MTAQRSGIATVMFTDVEASTETTTRLGDDAASALFTAHHGVVREQIAAFDGHHVESTGDGFLVLFDSARAGLGCALAIQRELAAREDGIRVRVGLSAGEVMRDDDQLFGAAINLAKRVMDRADGGQILLTDTVRQLSGTMPGARFRDRGRAALKGFPERRRLYEVSPTGVRPAPRAAAPRGRSRRPGVLAAVAVALVGSAGVLVAMRDDPPVAVRPNSVAIVDPDEGRVVGQVPVGVNPGALAAGAGSVWVANNGDGTMTQIGARSHDVAGSVSPGIALTGIGVGPSGVWVADDQRALARVVDPTFRSVARSVRLTDTKFPVDARPLAVARDAVWIASSAGATRVDPRTGRTVARVPIGNGPSDVAIGAGGVWISDGEDGSLTRIDPETNEVAAIIAARARAASPSMTRASG